MWKILILTPGWKSFGFVCKCSQIFSLTSGYCRYSPNFLSFAAFTKLDKLWSIQLHFLYLFIALLIIIFHLIIQQSLATCCYMICVNFLRNTVLTSSSDLLTLKSLISFLVIEALVSPPTRYATYLTKYYPNASFNL